MVQIQRLNVSLSQRCRGQIKRNHEQIVALASIPKEERPAILEELKKKKPTATENNAAPQAEQPETSVQEPITESPPEAEILRQKIAAAGKS